MLNPNWNQKVEYSVRIRGLEYASKVFNRWMGSGIVSYGFDVRLQSQLLLHGLSLRPIKGFSYPTPIELWSAVGFPIELWSAVGFFTGTGDFALDCYRNMVTSNGFCSTLKI